MHPAIGHTDRQIRWTVLNIVGGSQSRCSTSSMMTRPLCLSVTSAGRADDSSQGAGERKAEHNSVTVLSQKLIQLQAEFLAQKEEKITN